MKIMPLSTRRASARSGEAPRYISRKNSTRHELIANGHFSYSVKPGTRAVGWRTGTMTEWLASRDVA